MFSIPQFAVAVTLFVGLSANAVSAATYVSGDILTIGSRTVEISDGETIVGTMGAGFEIDLTSTGSDLVSFSPFTINPVSVASTEKPATVSPTTSTGENPIVGFTSFITNLSNISSMLLYSDAYYGISVSGSVVTALFNNVPVTGSVVGLPDYGNYVILTFVMADGTSLVGNIASDDILSVTVNGANSAVPIPASGWMILSAVSCLIVSRKIKRRFSAVG